MELRLYINKAFLLGILLIQNNIVAQKNTSEVEWEVFPILNYDTDVGFGYGLKGFFYNYLNSGESIDLTAYNSTKGERWYRFVYSVPDMQRRQGKKYNLAFDFVIDYDKYINYRYYTDWDNFSSSKNSSKYENYIREPIEISAVFSRAFTTDFIAELGLKFKSISCYNFYSEGVLQYIKPSTVQHLSLLFNFRIDTRTNFINPQKGIVLQISNEYAKDVLGEGQSFFKIGLTLQSYLQIAHPKLILASRIILQTETDAPYQALLSLGGNRTVRGIPQDRYLSQSFVLFNEELRFPIWWRFGGIVGADIGNSTSTPGWIINSILGIRFYMDNFIVRADFGFGNESAGFYFNFGHLF